MLSDFQAASVLQASGFRFDVTVFRSVQRPRANVAGNLRLRRHGMTSITKPVLIAALLGLLALVPVAIAGQPVTQTLTPAPLPFYTR